MAGYTDLLGYAFTDMGVHETAVVRHLDVPTDKYPSGYDYRLHLGTLQGTTLIRYDNGHFGDEHHRHVAGVEETIEFPGMWPLYARFTAEANAVWLALGRTPPERK